MNPFNVFDNKRQETQLVIVLQEEQACWFRWRGQELTGSYREPVAAGALSTQTLCPWVRTEVGDSECPVRLVLDTRLDEVDRVKVDGMSKRWLQAVQRRRMASRLHADYPLASIHLLPDYASPDVLSIVHHLIPAGWEDWLSLLQSRDVCITHAITSLELFCELSRNRSLLGNSLAHSVESRIDGPVLFNVPVGNERRHLLVDKGVPLFMRMVDVVGGAAQACNDATLQESLQHVRDQVTHDERTPPVLVPVPPWPELEQQLQPASVLAALSIGRSVSLQHMTTALDGESVPAIAVDEAGEQSTGKSGVTRLISEVSASVDKLRRRRGRQQRWRLTDSLRFGGDFLQPSINRNRLNLRIQKLQEATMLCAWMAAASVVFASAHGINSARDGARLSKEQQQLTRKTDRLAESVTALNDDPGFVVRSVARIEAHERVWPIEANDVLATIASAISDYPAIVLDSLSWTVMTENQPVDLAFAAMSQVPQRAQLWDSDSAVARLQVEIAGTVTDQPGLGLREQQRVLESFVEHLQAMPRVAELKVLEAPVNAARSSERTAHDGSGYHLSLQLGVF